MASAWQAAESAAERKPDGKARARLASELTEPVAQRILYPYEGSRHLRSDGVYPGCWPNKAHTTTNVLCAIMQACPVDSPPLQSSEKTLVKTSISEALHSCESSAMRHDQHVLPCISSEGPSHCLCSAVADVPHNTRPAYANEVHHIVTNLPNTDNVITLVM